MNTQHTLSPGLLVSIAPEDLHALHLDEDGKGEEFDWEAKETGSLFRVVFDYLRSLV